MNTYDYIFKRKSTRNYDMTPLANEELSDINSVVKNLVPLFNGINTSYFIEDNAKNLLPIKAPHYIIFYSEQSDGYLENAGFMLQQMDLYLSSIGMGSCWLGLAKPTHKDKGDLAFIIIIAFGRAVDSPYRELSEFKRKPLSEISEGTDIRLEAARLSPSATNSQNWYFVVDGTTIHVYRKNLGTLKSIMYGKMNSIDSGIAICHLYYATANEKKPFAFVTHREHPEVSGYTFVGSVL